ncbi:MAG: hypothetical protein ACKV19_08700 [Verrucomicrobiales bacterium]
MDRRPPTADRRPPTADLLASSRCVAEGEAGMPRSSDIECTAPPTLDFVATGGQSLIFGTPVWVVKIPRRSWQSVLGRVLVHPRTPVRALDVLGGLLEPFVLVEHACFRGVRWQNGRPVAGSERWWSARWAVAAPRLAADDFLDRRLATATAPEAADLIASLLATLDAIRARGWHVLDFILSNFVVGADGRVRLVDAGLLIPRAHLWGPSQQMTSRLFVRRLVRDYAKVLAGVAARDPHDSAGQARLAAVTAQFSARITAWRQGREMAAPGELGFAVPTLPLRLRAEIFHTLRPDRHKLLLTPRPSSGYTPPHHAIPSEN